MDPQNFTFLLLHISGDIEVPRLLPMTSHVPIPRSNYLNLRDVRGLLFLTIAERKRLLRNAKD